MRGFILGGCRKSSRLPRKCRRAYCLERVLGALQWRLYYQHRDWRMSVQLDAYQIDRTKVQTRFLIVIFLHSCLPSHFPLATFQSRNRISHFIIRLKTPCSPRENHPPRQPSNDHHHQLMQLITPPPSNHTHPHTSPSPP